MSNDVRILLPVMVAIMIAKFVADAATHSLYHGLLEVKCVPFLPKDVSRRRLYMESCWGCSRAGLHGQWGLVACLVLRIVGRAMCRKPRAEATKRAGTSVCGYLLWPACLLRGAAGILTPLAPCPAHPAAPLHHQPRPGGGAVRHGSSGGHAAGADAARRRAVSEQTGGA